MNAKARDEVGFSRNMQETPGVYTNLSKSVRFIADKLTVPFIKSNNSSQADTCIITATSVISNPNPKPTIINPPPKPSSRAKMPSRSF
jgi:hypothetical protein